MSRHVGTDLSLREIIETKSSVREEMMEVGKIGQRKCEIRGTAGLLLG